MNIKAKIAAVVAGVVLMTGALAGCSASEYEQRKEIQKQTTISGESLEKKNLIERLERQEDPNTIRYVYVTNYGEFVGYYTINGKVSSAGSQIAPEQEVIRGYGGEGYTLDSAQDDGTYGSGDDGIFFFTTDGVLVETDFNYIVSDQPLKNYIDLPQLG